MGGAQSGGDPNSMVQGLLTDFVSGAVAGGYDGAPGMLAGTVISVGTSSAYNLVNRSLNTPVPTAPHVRQLRYEHGVRGSRRSHEADGRVDGDHARGCDI